MPKKTKLPTDFTSLERQALAGKLPVQLKSDPRAEVFKDLITINLSTTIECVRLEPPQNLIGTIFYIPGTASIAHFPSITNAECSHLAFRSGCKVIVVYHRLSGQNKYPIPLNDICKVLEYYLKNYKSYGIDPEKIAIAGYSAGGLLATQICKACIQQKRFYFRQLILVAPITSLADETRSYGDGIRQENTSNEKKKEAFFLTREFFLAMVNDYVPKEMKPESSLFSPSNNPQGAFIGFPPVTIISGEHECFSNDTTRFVQLLKIDGVDVQHSILKNENHCFPWEVGDYFDDVLKTRITLIFNSTLVDEMVSHNREFEFPYFSSPQLAIYGDIPNLSDKIFVSRSNYMEAITDYFKETSLLGENRKLFSLFGMGGQGKTQLALNYFFTHHRYNYRWWFTVTDAKVINEYQNEENQFGSDALNAEYRKIAIKSGLADSETSISLCINRVKEWLESRTGWLIVFDDVASFEKVEHYLPRFGGHILITTRQQQWQHGVEIKGMEYDEAIILVNNILGYSEDPIEMGELVNRFGLHPLAIAQVCAYIRENKIDINIFFQHYEREKEQVLRSGRSILNHMQHVSFFITWKMILKCISKVSKDALLILRACIFLACSNVPSRILENILVSASFDSFEQVYNEQEIKARYLKAIHILSEGYSILSIIKNLNEEIKYVSIHPLVQEVLSHFLDVKNKTVTINLLLKSVYRFSEINKIKFTGGDVGHLRYLLDNAEKIDGAQLDSFCLSHVFVILAFLQCDSLCSPDALTTIHKAEKCYSNSDDINQTLKMKIESARMFAYWLSGDFINGLRTAESIYPFFQCTKNIPESAKAAHNLASVYHKLGRLENAEKMLNDAIDGFTKVSEMEPALLAKASKSRVILAYVYIDQGKLDLAIEYLDTVIKYINEEDDNDHVNILSEHCRGLALIAKNDIQNGRRYLEESINMWKKDFEGYHRLIAENEIRLAILLNTEEEMIRKLRQAFNMLFAIYTEDNLHVATAYIEAGISLFKYDANIARQILFRSYEILRNALPVEYFDDHFKVKRILKHLSIAEITLLQAKMITGKDVRTQLLQVLKQPLDQNVSLTNVALSIVKESVSKENVVKQDNTEKESYWINACYSSIEILLKRKNLLFFAAGFVAGAATTLVVNSVQETFNASAS